jgi:catechol 2,3-dioxygenase-like lactoylglutathione lyase family enzyme
MFARINHIAINSDVYAINGKFYEALFGLRPSGKPRPARAVVLKDGYVGLNNNVRHEGARSGIDHFGIEVEDIALAVERIKKFDPGLETVKRPSRRPFAAYSAHDPEINIFDLSQRDSDAQKDVYSESGWTQPRTISHLAIRARDPERCARFYSEVFELTVERKPGDENVYVHDGRVTLLLMPWKMSDYVGQNPIAPGIEHFGFNVESIDALKSEMDELLSNPRLASWQLGKGDEGGARLKLFQRCPLGTFHITDVEGAYVDVAEHARA